MLWKVAIHISIIAHAYSTVVKVILIVVKVILNLAHASYIVESMHMYMWLSNNESNDVFVIRTQSEEQKLIKATMLWRHVRLKKASSDECSKRQLLPHALFTAGVK